MRRMVLLSLIASLAAGLCEAETVKLKSTANIWVSDAPSEMDTSGGKCGVFKLKSIQEMAMIRFDAAPAKGKEVLKARLWLHREGADQLRYVRISTVAQDWEQGTATQPYSPGNGATYNHADAASKRPWTFTGSQICDACMSAGNTLASWAERKEEAGGWLSVDVAPDLIYAMAAGDTDGLAVCDGGTILLANNMLSSVQSGAAPYIDVELGAALTDAPGAPVVKATPALDHAHMDFGAIKVSITDAKQTLCWHVKLNGKAVERWRVRHPAKTGPTEFWIEDLQPSQKCELEVVAMGRGGTASPVTKVSVNASPALDGKLELKAFHENKGIGSELNSDGKMKVWAYPGLVKISPEKPELLFADEGGSEPIQNANSVWNGKDITLFGCKGEYVSYQLCIEKLAEPLKGIAVKPDVLKGAGGATIDLTDIELFQNWYAQNGAKQWQPAYCVPLTAQQTLEIPDPKRKLANQENQSIYVDVYIPKDAKPGDYTGSISVQAENAKAVTLPVKLTVLDFLMPDKLSFWPELNGYSTPPHVQACIKLAHQNRCVVNLNNATWAPQLQGSGKDIKVVWDEYDKNAGPLHSGELFKSNRRSGVPLEVMYLPYCDSWPTPLSQQTYNYPGHWPGRGEKNDFINEQMLKAPYIGDGLSQSYKDAFLAVEKQYIEHFKQKGWNQTEMQCFFGGKNTHRTDYGSNMWWTTDEPYHWEDWLALQFFCKLWTEGRGDADPKVWSTRGDISRPNWQGRVMDGILSTMYIGGFSSPASYRRGRALHEDTGVKIMAYGSANPDAASNTRSVVLVMNTWMNGANGILPWQCFGPDAALDSNDASAGGGNALIVPGDRFGIEAAGDMRLKALRDGEQVVEYLTILAQRRHLEREQVKALVLKAVNIKAGRKAGAGADNADALEFTTLPAWQLSELRKNLASLIVEK
jgi:hypothetical protein